MKTLVFSTNVVPDGTPPGFSGKFKMLHLETGQLYVYRVHIPKHIYVGSHVPGMGSPSEDRKWWQSMFHALAEFIQAYNEKFGCLPSDQNIYQDRRPYTFDQQPFGEKIYFMVDGHKQRALDQKQLIIDETIDMHPHE